MAAVIAQPVLPVALPGPIAALNRTERRRAASAVNPSSITGNIISATRQWTTCRSTSPTASNSLGPWQDTFFPLHPCSGARDIGQGQQNPDHQLAFITFLDCAPCISDRCRGPRSAVFHAARPVAVSPVAAVHLESVASSPNRAWSWRTRSNAAINRAAEEVAVPKRR